MPDVNGIIALAEWKVTLPVKAVGKDGPQELSGTDLTRHTSAWLQRAGDGLEFAAPVNGVTTSGSHYPRSELRHFAAGGDWSTTKGYTLIEWEESFDRLPAVKPEVVGAQIHGTKDDVTVFRLEGAKLWVTKGDDSNFALADGNYVLGTRYRGRYEVGDGVVRAFYNDRLVTTIAVKASGCYAKLGAYVQANCTNSKPCSDQNYGQVTLYSGKVTRSDKPITRTPPPEPAPMPPGPQTPWSPPPAPEGVDKTLWGQLMDVIRKVLGR